MKKLSILLFILLFLSACNKEPNSSSSKNVIAIQENHRIQIQFLEQTAGVVDGEKGFYLHFLLSELSDAPLNEANYTLALPRTLYIDEKPYEAKEKKLVSTNEQGEVLPDNTLYLKQFFTPELPSGKSIIPVTFYVRPMYYKRDLLFSNLNKTEQNISQNDLKIVDLQIDKKNLSLHLEDVHNLQGIVATLIIHGEEIYPVFTSTDYNEYSNSIRISSEFVFTPPDDFTLKLTRHRLQDIVWEFPFILGVEN